MESGTVTRGHSGEVARIPLAELSKEARQLLKLEPTLKIAKKDFLKQIDGFKAGLEELNL